MTERGISQRRKWQISKSNWRWSSQFWTSQFIKIRSFKWCSFLKLDNLERSLEIGRVGSNEKSNAGSTWASGENREHPGFSLGTDKAVGHSLQWVDQAAEVETIDGGHQKEFSKDFAEAEAFEIESQRGIWIWDPHSLVAQLRYLQQQAFSKTRVVWADLGF
jgi:hypothetical protein